MSRFSSSSMSRSNKSDSSNSVQSILVGLQRETEQLRNDTQAILRTKSTSDAELQQLKSTYHALGQTKQCYQETLGGFHGKQRICEQEHARVQHQLSLIRSELAEWNRRVDQCRQDEASKKQSYCKTMLELGDRQEELLHQLEAVRLMSVVSSETVGLLVELSDNINNKDAMQIDGIVGNSQNRLTEKAVTFKNTADQMQQARDDNVILLQQLAVFRQQAMETRTKKNSVVDTNNYKLGENDLLELEALWKEGPQAAGKKSEYNRDNVPEHMDLFYGDTGSDCVDDHEMEEGDNQEQDGRLSESNRME